MHNDLLVFDLAFDDNPNPDVPNSCGSNQRGPNLTLTKYSMVVLTLLSFFSLAAMAEEITLEWDIPDIIPDGYRIFQTVPYQDELGAWHHEYDYINPVVTTAYQDGNIPPDVYSIVVDLPGRPNEVTNYLFVARSFIDQEQSQDSNQVSYKVVNIPPITPTELMGEFDKGAGVITLTWTQPEDDYYIEKWIIYYRRDGPDFIELGSVDQGQELTLTADSDFLGDSDLSVVDFVVVAFRSSGVFSANSVEHSIPIDRREVAPVNNLRIKIDIPI